VIVLSPDAVQRATLPSRDLCDRREAAALQRIAKALRSVRGHENYFPNFSCSIGHSRSGLNGVAVKRMPVALAMALPSAAATGL
jgi:hypothetical protein